MEFKPTSPCLRYRDASTAPVPWQVRMPFLQNFSTNSVDSLDSADTRLSCLGFCLNDNLLTPHWLLNTELKWHSKSNKLSIVKIIYFLN